MQGRSSCRQPPLRACALRRCGSLSPWASTATARSLCAPAVTSSEKSPATLMSAASMLLFLQAPSYGWFLTACVVWSLATGVSGAAPAAYAADVAPPGMNAAAMSAFRMLSDAGYVLGPIVLGLITDLFGADVALATAAVLLAAAAILFARFAPESHR